MDTTTDIILMIIITFVTIGPMIFLFCKARSYKEEEEEEEIRSLTQSYIDDRVVSEHFDFNNEECSICLDKFDFDIENNSLVLLLDCGHHFHVHCVKDWIMEKKTCPLCRENVV